MAFHTVKWLKKKKCTIKCVRFAGCIADTRETNRPRCTHRIVVWMCIRNVCVCFNYIYVTVFTGWSKSIRDRAYLEIYMYIYMYTWNGGRRKINSREWRRRSLDPPYESIYFLATNFRKIAKHSETNGSNQLPWFHPWCIFFFSARSDGENIGWGNI